MKISKTKITQLDEKTTRVFFIIEKPEINAEFGLDFKNWFGLGVWAFTGKVTKDLIYFWVDLPNKIYAKTKYIKTIIKPPVGNLVAETQRFHSKKLG